MTIASIAAVARQRSAAPSPGAPRGSGVAPAAATPGHDSSADIASLANAVPIDVIVLYTTVIGVLAGVLKNAGADSYLPLRWYIYFGCIAGICILVPVTYYLQNTDDSAPLPVPRLPVGPPVGQHLAPDEFGAAGRAPTLVGAPRRIPVSETIIAVLAFAFWGLVVPGSPLYVWLDPPTLPVTVTTLSAVGVFVLTSIAIPLLKRPAQPGRPRPAPQPTGSHP
jgi:hypothetical protein